MTSFEHPASCAPMDIAVERNASRWVDLAFVLKLPEVLDTLRGSVDLIIVKITVSIRNEDETHEYLP